MVRGLEDPGCFLCEFADVIRAPWLAGRLMTAAVQVIREDYGEFSFTKTMGNLSEQNYPDCIQK